MARRRKKRRNPDPTEGLLLAAALGSLTGAGTAAVTTSSLSEKHSPGKRITAGILLGATAATVVVAGTMMWVVASRKR